MSVNALVVGVIVCEVIAVGAKVEIAIDLDEAVTVSPEHSVATTVQLIEKLPSVQTPPGQNKGFVPVLPPRSHVVPTDISP